MVRAKIKFGPAGIGSIKEAVNNLWKYHEMGLKACEIPFTYVVFIKKDRHEKEIREIRKAGEKFGIEVSIHAPYWINLNSEEDEKIEASKKRILDSCEIGHLLSEDGKKMRIVFHCGFYGSRDLDDEKKELAYQNIRMRILEMMQVVKRKKWNVELCPEIIGKKNVFGSIEEIARLVNETECGFCIDFAHVLARYGRHEFELLKKSFPQKKWHCHFSGIEFGEKGEKHHRKTEEGEWKELLDNLKNLDKDIVIINEADDPVEDSLVGLRVWKMSKGHVS